MDMKRIICIATMALVLGGVVSAEEGRPYIGVRLDPAPLPELLTKHLGLETGQGIRIRNVNIGSPADTIGLRNGTSISCSALRMISIASSKRPASTYVPSVKSSVIITATTGCVFRICSSAAICDLSALAACPRK